MKPGFTEKHREIIAYAASKNIIVAQDALSLLENEPDYPAILDSFESAGKNFINEADAREHIVKSKTRMSSVASEFVVEKSGFMAEAKGIEADLRFLKEYDITGKSNSEGKVENFLE